MNEVFSGTDYEPAFKYLPIKRIPKAFTHERLDVATNIKEGVFKDKFYSFNVLSFENYAISLTKNNLKVETLNDLNHLSVIAFQDAHLVFGSDFSDMAKDNQQYQELFSQTAQVEMLFRDRVDVIICDKRVFKYILKKLKQEKSQLADKFEQQVTFSRVLPLIDLPFVFQSDRVKNLFNRN